jgi:hypothetical protein
MALRVAFRLRRRTAAAGGRPQAGLEECRGSCNDPERTLPFSWTAHSAVSVTRQITAASSLQ